MEAIRFIGRSGHASNPRYGNSALEGMTELVAELQHYRDHTLLAHRNPAFEVDSPTVNFGRISGGDNPNRICGDCELQLDVRLLPGMDLDETRNQIRDAAEKVARRRGLKVECAALFDGVPAFHTPENAAIVQCVQKLCGCHAGAVAFATEGPYLARMGMDTIIMGPGDIAVAHQPDEHLEIAAIPRTLEILKGLIQHYCR